MPNGGRWLPVYNPILWRSGALGCSASGGFWLSDAPERWGPAWGARWTRSATWIKIGPAHDPVIILNLHLDHVSARARLQSLELVFERLTRLGWPAIPTVIMGDFNASPGGPEHQLCLAAGMLDSWRSAGRVDDLEAFSYHGFEGRRFPDETRIDWILHTPHFHARDARIIKDARPPRYPSDHYPVWAELSRAPTAEEQPDGSLP